MKEDQFALEDKLQELVADHPSLLSGEQINPEEPRRWILVDREQGIADNLGGGQRWALDLLLLDQEAIPTLVEAKLSRNPEIRRSIVGQVLEYAAYATQTWEVDDLRNAFNERCQRDGRDPNGELGKFLKSDAEQDADNFWEKVGKNLRSAHLRLLFVADSIPNELARIVEFLNEQMHNTEVLAVEIKQFSGKKGRTLVPRVIGRTASAPDRSSKRRGTKTLEEILEQMPSTSIRQAAQRLIDVAKEKGGIVYPGSIAFSIRYASPVLKHPISLAWINPIPEYSGWMGTKNFTFGMYNYHDYEPEGRPPAEAIEILKSWVNQFKDDTFVDEYPYEGLDAWIVKHEDAADNIDIIAERLGKVLDDLRILTSPVGPAC